MLALCSLSPAEAHAATQTACIASWRAAGLEPASINCAAEVEVLRPRYDVKYVTTEGVATARFGKPFVTLKAVIDWIGTQPDPVLILNGDLHVLPERTKLEHLRRLASDGVPYLLQWNVDADQGRPELEPCGISAFVFNPKYASLFGESFLCLGQPWWDYWLPYEFVRQGIPLYSAGGALAFHVRHAQHAWSRDNWRICAMEMARLIGAVGVDDFDSCSRLSANVYKAIVAATRPVDLGASA